MAKGQGILYLCPTPIGNLEDITLRALRILKEVDIVAAEDTRVTIKLLNHYDIKARQMSYHEHNERSKGPEIIEHIKAGKDVAVVTDAGTPGLSDPGADLVRLAVEAGIRVVPLPGAAAAVCALVASGLNTDRFVFEGFLPRRSRERRQVLDQLTSEPRTIILYESPHRVQKTLGELQNLLGNRRIALAREMTKLHEEIFRGTIAEALKAFEANKPRGELVLVIEGIDTGSDTALPAMDPKTLQALLNEKMKEAMDQGIQKKQAMKRAAEELGISRNEAYKLTMEDKPMAKDHPNA